MSGYKTLELPGLGRYTHRSPDLPFDFRHRLLQAFELVERVNVCSPCLLAGANEQNHHEDTTV